VTNLQPCEALVALVDMGLYGRYLSIGSRLAGEILQWFDGEELHLVRGRLLPERARKRSFEFERAADGQVLKFSELTAADFRKRFREQFPDAPPEAGSRELCAWLREHHGLWK
jgi:hypothetical protein